MSREFRITALRHLDSVGVRGSAGACDSWQDLGVDPARGEVAWKRLFASPFRGFRRLDITSGMFVIAVEGLGLDALDEDVRRSTALVLASSTGCLAADLRFEASLRSPTGIKPAVFPYTLPSTCLGEVAIRHKLMGPTLCVSVDAGEERQGVDAARELLRAGEALAAVVLLGDWVPATARIPAKTNLAALLLQQTATDTSLDASLEQTGEDILSGISRLLS